MYNNVKPILLNFICDRNNWRAITFGWVTQISFWNISNFSSQGPLGCDTM